MHGLTASWQRNVCANAHPRPEVHTRLCTPSCPCRTSLFDLPRAGPSSSSSAPVSVLFFVSMLGRAQATTQARRTICGATASATPPPRWAWTSAAASVTQPSGFVRRCHPRCVATTAPSLLLLTPYDSNHNNIHYNSNKEDIIRLYTCIDVYDLWIYGLYHHYLYRPAGDAINFPLPPTKR